MQLNWNQFNSTTRLSVKTQKVYFCVIIFNIFFYFSVNNKRNNFIFVVFCNKIIICEHDKVSIKIRSMKLLIIRDSYDTSCVFWVLLFSKKKFVVWKWYPKLWMMRMRNGMTRKCQSNYFCMNRKFSIFLVFFIKYNKKLIIFWVTL